MKRTKHQFLEEKESELFKEFRRMERDRHERMLMINDYPYKPITK